MYALRQIGKTLGINRPYTRANLLRVYGVTTLVAMGPKQYFSTKKNDYEDKSPPSPVSQRRKLELPNNNNETIQKIYDEIMSTTTSFIKEGIEEKQKSEDIIFTNKETEKEHEYMFISKERKLEDQIIEFLKKQAPSYLVRLQAGLTMKNSGELPDGETGDYDKAIENFNSEKNKEFTKQQWENRPISKNIVFNNSLITTSNNISSESPDGRYLFYSVFNQTTPHHVFAGNALWLHIIDQTEKTHRLVVIGKGEGNKLLNELNNRTAPEVFGHAAEKIAIVLYDKELREGPKSGDIKEWYEDVMEKCPKEVRMKARAINFFSDMGKIIIILRKIGEKELNEEIQSLSNVEKELQINEKEEIKKIIEEEQEKEREEIAEQEKKEETIILTDLKKKPEKEKGINKIEEAMNDGGVTKEDGKKVIGVSMDEIVKREDDKEKEDRKKKESEDRTDEKQEKTVEEARGGK
jgi:hypothetical protein